MRRRHVAPDAPYPPVEAGFPVGLPAVERMPPSLAGFAEVVGRNPGNNAGAHGAVQLEQVRGGPYVRAVMGDVYGKIPQYADFFFRRPPFECAPLNIEHILDEPDEVHGFGQLVGGGVQGRWDPSAEGLRPAVPMGGFQALGNRREQGVVVQPPSVLLAKPFKLRVLF